MNKSVNANVYLMPASSDVTGINARKNLATLLQALSQAKQVAVASALGTSESTVSRMKDTDLPRLAKILSVLSLKAVPESMVVMDQRQIDALINLASQFNRGPIDER